MLASNASFLKCIKCGKPLLRVTEKSIVVNEIYCRYCRRYFDVQIFLGKVIKFEAAGETATA